MKVYYLLVLCLWGIIPKAHSQFFYSHFTPLHQQVSPIFHQPFYHQPAPLSYNLAPPLPPPQPQPVHSTIQYNLAPSAQPEFRGFGYRTDLKNGASSTVFFLTGAESENLKSFRDFPNFSRVFQKPSAAKARNLASDILDSTAVPDPEKKIQNTLDPKAFEQLFDNAMKGVVNFYSYPASTVPLSLSNNNSSGFNSNLDTENVVAESIVNTHVLVNQIDSIIKESKTTETSVPAETTTEVNIAKGSSTSTSTSSTSTDDVVDIVFSTSTESNDDDVHIVITSPTEAKVPEITTSTTESATTEDLESISVDARNSQNGSSTTEAESSETTTKEFRIIV